MRTRLPDIDLLRNLAMCAVILGHVAAGPPGSSSLVRSALYSWHVPLFFFLSGLLWNNQVTLKADAWKRFKQLIVPYVSWAVVLTAISSHFDHSPTFGTYLESLSDILVGGAQARGVFGAFWFLPVFFLAVLVLRLTDHVNHLFSWVIAIGGTAVSMIFQDKLHELPLYAGSIAPAVLFILAGRLYSTTVAPFFRHSLEAPIFVSMAVGALTLFIFQTISPLDLKFCDLGTPVLSIFGSTLICAGVVSLAQVLRPTLTKLSLSRPLAEAARVMVAVLLVHKLYLIAFAQLGLPLFSVFLLTAVSSWSTALCLAKTPLSQALIGVPRGSHLQRRRQLPGDPSMRTL